MRDKVESTLLFAAVVGAGVYVFIVLGTGNKVYCTWITTAIWAVYVLVASAAILILVNDFKWWRKGKGKQ